MSGVNLDGRQLRKGAADSVRTWVEEQGGSVSEEIDTIVAGIAVQGGTPLTVAEDDRVLGVVYLKDIVKDGMRQRQSLLGAETCLQSTAPGTGAASSRSHVLEFSQRPCNVVGGGVYLTLGALLMRLAKGRLAKFYCIALAAMLATLLVGSTRVFLGVHYPTDVLAGWLIGMLWALLCWMAERALERRAGLKREQRQYQEEG